MPKVQTDASLLGQVNNLVKFYGGVKAAAEAIGVGRTTLWRFQRSGRAIKRTRLIFQAAAKRHSNATNKEQSETNANSVNLPFLMDDLGKIKSMFQTMVTIIERYESSLSRSVMYGDASDKLSPKSTTKKTNTTRGA